MPESFIRNRADQFCTRTRDEARQAVSRFLDIATYGWGMKTNPAVLLLIGGILLIAVGAVWTLQGVGILAGSVMSGSTMWAVIGPIVAVVGIYLIVRWWRGRSKAA